MKIVSCLLGLQSASLEQKDTYLGVKLRFENTVGMFSVVRLAILPRADWVKCHDRSLEPSCRLARPMPNHDWESTPCLSLLPKTRAPRKCGPPKLGRNVRDLGWDNHTKTTL